MSINSVVNNSITNESVVGAQKPVPPTITGYTISGLDDTALDPAGGQTILLNGTGFQRGATVTINGVAISVVSFVNANQLSFSSPAQSAGTYTIYAVNANGGTAIYIPGLIYSNLPTWTTAAGTLGSYYETQTIANTVVASGDAPVTYSLLSGALPTGAVFNANGTISGSAPVDSGSTTYSFTIQATDAQLQDSTRSFSLTINTDVVSWVSPASGAIIELSGTPYSTTLSATSAAGYSIASYTANTLPTGITLSGNTVSGTPTTAGTTTTLLTATAATTGRSATRTISWIISIGDPNWKYTTLLLPGASAVFNQDASTNNLSLAIVGSVQPSNFSPFATSSATSNSAVFASGGYLSIPASSQFAIASSDDFCLEMWVYYTATPGGYSFMFSMGDGTNGLSFRTGDSGFQYKIQAEFGPSSLSSLFDNSSYTRSNLVGKWSHLVLCRASGTASFFFDGARIATKSSYTVALGTASGSINTASPYQFEGYASNIRFVKGSAVYNPAASSITVPTAPLTAIANTRLLALQNNQPVNNSTFFDTSTNKVSVTRYGSSTAGSFSPYGANWSNYFDGTGDYLTPAANGALAVGTLDFTFEAWVYLTGFNTWHSFVSTRGTENTGGATNVWCFGVNNTGYVYCYSGDFQAQGAAGVITLNTWYHVAISRSGSSMRLFVNGTQTGATGTTSQNYTVNTMTLGANNNGSEPIIGYMSNARLVKGTALYTSNFTPSTTPLTSTAQTSLLTCQSNRIQDVSSNNLAITKNGDVSVQKFSPFSPTSVYSPTTIGGSVYIDGSADNLLLPYNSGYNLPADFTIELWFYPTVAQGGMILNCGGGSNIAWASYELVFNASRVINFAASSANTGYDIGSESTGTGALGTVNLNQWNHIAVIRTGNTYKGFINGVLGFEQTLALTPYNQTTRGISVGANYTNTWGTGAPTSSICGYISDVRILKGTALYTGNFVPPTAPLTAITNTQLLLSFASAGIYDASTQNNLETVGDAKLSTAVTKWGTTSMYFDGTGDYLYSPPNINYALGSGDFTIEFWYYPVSQNAAYNPSIMGNYNVTWTTNKWAFHAPHASYANKYSFWVNNYNTGAAILYSTSNVTNGAWVHIAITRSGSTWKMFINGTVESTTTSSVALDGGTAASMDGFYVGANFYTGEQGRYINAYIDDLRITKGLARYTANFTAPIEAFQTK